MIIYVSLIIEDGILCLVFSILQIGQHLPDFDIGVDFARCGRLEVGDVVIELILLRL